jgi:hypothetical protein
MQTLAAAEEMIVALGRPVLMLDTCVLLDIIRAPVRDDVASVKAAIRLLSRITANPASVLLVVTSMVMDEWARNSPSVRDEVLVTIHKLNAQMESVYETCVAADISRADAPPTFDGAFIVSHLQQIATKLISSAIILANDDDCKTNAYQRVITKVPPSRKGGQLPDCEIIEHYLTLSDRLRSAAVVPKRLFVSSNTKDYCEDGKLHPELADQFSKVGLDFASNLSWGESSL